MYSQPMMPRGYSHIQLQILRGKARKRNVKLSEISSKYILYLGLHEKDKNRGSFFFLVGKTDFYILSHSGTKFSQCLFNEISH